MRKPTGIPREQFVKERRVGLYILPETRDRLNHIKKMLRERARSQDDVLNIVFDAFETGKAPVEAGHRE
jgi:hypothetical protein